jgi:hypothetical protein
MLTVIIDARAAPAKLPPLLAQLTAGAVDGLVREVLIVGPQAGLIDQLCGDMGAEAEPTPQAAFQRAKGQLVLALPADFRFREGWIERLSGFLAQGGKAAVVLGQGGLLSAPSGVLVERDRGLGCADLHGIRRQLKLRRRLH